MISTEILFPLLAGVVVLVVFTVLLVRAQHETQTQRAAWHKTAPSKKMSESSPKPKRKVFAFVKDKKLVLNVGKVIGIIVVIAILVWFAITNIDRVIPKRVVHTLSTMETPYEPVQLTIRAGASSPLFRIPGDPTNPVRWRACFVKPDDVALLYQRDRQGNPIGLWFENRSQETKRVRVVVAQTTIRCSVALPR